MPAKTLVAYLKEVESLPSYHIHKDRKDLYKKGFEEWISMSPLLKEDIGGKRGIIYEKVDGLAKKYGFLKRQLPGTISDGDSKDLQELEKIIGRIPVGKSDMKYMNPVFLIPGCGVAAGLFSSSLDKIIGMQEKKKLTRREFLGSAKFAAGMAGIGMLAAESIIIGDGLKMNNAREDARYVEEKIMELYP
jgi:hypothetical protein